MQTKYLILSTWWNYHYDEQWDASGHKAVSERSESVEGGVRPPDVGVSRDLHHPGQQEVNVRVSTKTGSVQGETIIHEGVWEPEIIIFHIKNLAKLDGILNL